MMKIKEPFKNKRIEIQISSMAKNSSKAMRQGLYKIGKELVKTASEGMKKEPKRGIYYKYKRRSIRASAPGQYPAVRSGTLRKSLDFNVKGTRIMIFGAGANYAGYVHDGTRKMKPRPFLTKADKQVSKQFDKIFHTEFQKTVNTRI